MGMMGEEEIVGKGDAVPGVADGAAAEECFGRQADEDLPYHDLLREATEGRRRSCPCGLGHGCRLRALDPSQEQKQAL